MHVISLRPLREFWSVHAEAEARLRAWYKTVSTGTWATLSELRATFGRATDVYEDMTIFDVGGNNYRIIAGVDYEKQIVYVKHVLTHAEYDRESWKRDAIRPTSPRRPAERKPGTAETGTLPEAKSAEGTAKKAAKKTPRRPRKKKS